MTLPPILLLHGAGGSYADTFVATGWPRVITEAGRQFVGLDLPGHARPDASRDPVHYADLTALLLGDLPAGEFDAVGFSLGAKLLLDLAIRAPGRIRRMVLGGVGDNVFAPEAVGIAVADALEHGACPTTPPPVLAFLKTWTPGTTAPLALAAVLRRPPNPVFRRESLATIATPVLIVNGQNDPVTTMGVQLTQALPNVTTLILPGCGHFELPGQPHFQSAALRFLNEPTDPHRAPARQPSREQF